MKSGARPCPDPSPSGTGRSAGRAEHAAAWSIVNDGVMGGVSSSRVEPADEGLRFEGELRLEFNGGFASMRRAAQWPADSPGVRVRARGDGNAYRLVLYTRDPVSGRPRPYSYHAVFSPPADAAEPSAVVELHWPRFRASFRGRAVPDAAPLVAADVIGVGVMITKDGHRAGQGAFVLHLAGIAPLP
jgi:monofunctional biosynthetic peptidoglycan transglycosylase